MYVRSFVEAKAEKGTVRVMARCIACRSIARLEVPSEDQWINTSNVQTGRRTPPRDVRPRLERIAR